MEERPARWQPAWTLAALVLFGLALRSYHYLRVPSLWHDEAALAMNVLGKDFGQLLGPLLWHEAAPPLFLWVERIVFLTLGDSLLALRLVPFLASCAALLLMVPVARALLPKPAVPWAVFLFACSEQLAWHACEAKPYALDVLAAVLLLVVYCAGKDRPVSWRLIAYTLLAPFLIFLSYPACFLYGGVLAASLPAVWRRGRLSALADYALLCLTLTIAFGFLVAGPAQAQRDGAIMSCWLDFFPDWSRPWSVPGWAVASTLGVFRYCCKPLGEVLLVLAGMGAVSCWRGGRRSLVVLLVVPLLMALAAACLRRYPYGGARVMVYGAPAVVLLIAAGVPTALAWLRSQSRVGMAVLVVLVCLPAVRAVRSVAAPWPRPDTAGATAYVNGHRLPADVVLGNDWTHFYYFRQLGSRFQAEAEEVKTTGRVWVVYTAQVPAEKRLQAARTWAERGRRIIERREFEFTTVLLLGRLRVE
jgi:uncharacterized membrane protein